MEINLLDLTPCEKQYKYTIFYTCQKELQTMIGNCQYFTDYKIEYLNIKELENYLKNYFNYDSFIITNWKYMYSKDEFKP